MADRQRVSASSGQHDETRVGALVVPLDGSAFAEHALPVAARIAARLGADLHILSVVADGADEPVRSKDLVRVRHPSSSFRPPAR
jgi:nucleotide-binding universal stress UspA family protein